MPLYTVFQVQTFVYFSSSTWLLLHVYVVIINLQNYLLTELSWYERKILVCRQLSNIILAGVVSSWTIDCWVMTMHFWVIIHFRSRSGHYSLVSRWTKLIYRISSLSANRSIPSWLWWHLSVAIRFGLNKPHHVSVCWLPFTVSIIMLGAANRHHKNQKTLKREEH